jgi:hypothetical protein
MTRLYIYLQESEIGYYSFNSECHVNALWALRQAMQLPVWFNDITETFQVVKVMDSSLPANHTPTMPKRCSFGGLVVSMLASGTQDRRFKPPSDFFRA